MFVLNFSMRRLFTLTSCAQQPLRIIIPVNHYYPESIEELQYVPKPLFEFYDQATTLEVLLAELIQLIFAGYLQLLIPFEFFEK